MTYITTPIYYANGAPHIGHLYTNFLADTLSRYYTQQGQDVFFLTGTDEHGQKILKTAIEQNIPVQTFVDTIVDKFKHLWELADCKYHHFIRTTDQYHKDYVIKIWNAMIDNDDIYLGKYAGWYSIRDEAFFSADEIINGCAPTGASVEWIEEDSYFFRLSKFQEPLLKFYENNPDFIQPSSRYNEVIAFVKRGLKDLSVSRQNLSWGIKVPNSNNQTIYVWLDALFNYISGSKSWPADIQIIGKDIVIFHGVYWPAFLMSLNLELPKTILTHGWWTVNNEKMSKSLGNVIDPYHLLNKFGADYVRYFMLREISVGNDGNYSESTFINRINSEVVNNIGNLVQRTFKLAHQVFNGMVPNISDNAIDSINDRIKNYMQEFKFNEAIDIILEVARSANAYINKTQPWSITDKTQQAKILSILLKIIYQIAYHLEPFLPQNSQKILSLMSINDTTIALKSIDILFKKL